MTDFAAEPDHATEIHRQIQRSVAQNSNIHKDRKEAVAAFRQRRKPNLTGN